MIGDKGHVAKVGHKKTRTGCLKCRARKVKCDEQAPICANCRRLGLECKYANNTQSSQRRQVPTSNALPTPRSDRQGSTTDDRSSIGPSSHGSPNSSTSTAERLKRMELYLMHAYMSRAVASTSAVRTSAEWRKAWFCDLPALAFQHDNLLYALLAFSATQISARPVPDLALAQAEFWSMALKEQRIAIAASEHNSEATTLAGYLICMTSFGMLRERQLAPYNPPLEWFETAQGALTVSLEELARGPESNVLPTIFRLTKPLRDESLRHHVDDIYLPILSYQLTEELQTYGGDLEDLRIYRETLAAVSRFRRFTSDQEPLFLQISWICTFPQIIPSKFVRLLQERRPRALVVLACFWSVLASADPFVLQAFGDINGCIPRRELSAILQSVASSWHGLIEEQRDERRGTDS